MDRIIDPETISSIGNGQCQDIYLKYLELIDLSNTAGSFRDAAFSGSSGAAGAVGDTWSDCYILFFDCIYETAENVHVFGRALVELAESAEADEDEIAASMQDAADWYESNGYTTVDEQIPDDAAPETAEQDTFELEQAPNPYEDALGPPAGQPGTTTGA
jgi:hypothetical protein